jgi:cyclopropane fatty-acyl-phospholipid synthase-like methyltransferase
LIPWEGFYDSIFAERVLGQANPLEVEGMARMLGLEPGQRLLDQCCGVGRLSLPLAQRGLEVVGVEREAAYVEQARRLCQGQSCQFHEADAGSFVVVPGCHAAINAYSSFGYGPDDVENGRLLERARDSLLPGGRFLLDTINAARVLASFAATLEHTYPDGVQLTRECRLHWTSGMLEQDWHYRFPDGRVHSRRGDTKLYLPHQLIAMLQSSGLAFEQLYGSYAGEPFGSDSPRLILVARRF